MNHEVLKQVIFDQRRVMQRMEIVPRAYALEPHANYIITGMRRCGKSTLLYKRARDLVAAGCIWDQIIYINFEDERLLGFSLADFNDIIQTAAELTSEEPYFFFDEIQNIQGWERFARRMADEKRRVCITGSNAEMLSGEMELRLGGRYMVFELSTYSFAEYLDASHIRHDMEACHTSELIGPIQLAAQDYLRCGGLPESIGFIDRRAYADAVYQKVLLGDIAARHKVRNIFPLRMLVKKLAETVTSEISYNALSKAVTATGASLSVDAAISYIGYAEDAYLIFSIQNCIARFAQHEGTPRFYFTDNGMLDLFLYDKDPLLLENVVAMDLRRRFGSQLTYFKSRRTGIDIDFYLPDESWAIQVTYTLDELSSKQEIGSLVKLAKDQRMAPARSTIVTLADDERTIEVEGSRIEIMPLWKFLLGA